MAYPGTWCASAYGGGLYPRGDYCGSLYPERNRNIPFPPGRRSDYPPLWLNPQTFQPVTAFPAPDQFTASEPKREPFRPLNGQPSVEPLVGQNAGQPPKMKEGPSTSPKEGDSTLEILADSLSRIPESERTPLEQGTSRDVYDRMSRFTTENSSAPVKILDYWLNLQSFFAAMLHGGPTPRQKALKALQPDVLKFKLGRQSGYQPERYLGVWPGIYRPNGMARKAFIEPVSILGCIWDGFNAFFNYAAQYNSLGTGLVAGMAEAASATGFGCYYAESILYPCMDATMKGLALLSPHIKRINRELAGELPKQLTRQGIPLSYRMARTCVGGAVGLVVIESVIRAFSHWVTPTLAKSLGPRLDQAFGATPNGSNRNGHPAFGPQPLGHPMPAVIRNGNPFYTRPVRG